MLGHKLVQVLNPRFEVWSAIRSSFDTVASFGIFDKDRTIGAIDANNFETVLSAIRVAEPDVVINSIGIVKQKKSAKDIVETLTVNSIFPQQLGEACKDIGFRLINVSTDCVFSGSRGNYSEKDIADAMDLYGQSKHWGEVFGDNRLTIRTSIIGRELFSGHGLLEWLLDQKGKAIDGYTKAVFSGFPTAEFADIIVDIIENHPSMAGVFHISSDPITKFDLLSKISDAFDLGIIINEFPDLVLDRSLNSARFRELTGFQPKSWEMMIEELAADTTPYDKWKTANN